MSDNANNYVGHELDWTEYTGTDSIPLGAFVVRITDDSADSDYEYFFGEKTKRISIIRGGLDFDYKDILIDGGGEWASLNFVFKLDNDSQ